MTKEKWLEHMEDSTGLKRPSIGGSKIEWKSAHSYHLAEKCPSCVDRLKTFKANLNAKAIRSAYASVGMVRVRGANGGVYYE